jgi:hypothetical protein
MPCSTLTAITKSCANNMGGIREVYLWDMEDVNVTGGTAIYNFDQSTYFWTAYNLAGGTGATATPVGYEFTRNSSNYVEEGTIDLVAGSSYVKQTLTLNFSRREALKSQAIKLMGEGQRYLGALVLDSNGLFWLFEELQLSASGEGSGTARADGSKYSVTLVAENLNLAGEVAVADAALLVSQGFYP